MLWILLVVGAVGALFMLIWTIIMLFELNWYEARDSAIKFGICLVIGAVGLFGLAGIDALSYEEVSKTGYK